MKEEGGRKEARFWHHTQFLALFCVSATEGQGVSSGAVRLGDYWAARSDHGHGRLQIEIYDLKRMSCNKA